MATSTGKKKATRTSRKGAAAIVKQAKRTGVPTVKKVEVQPARSKRAKPAASKQPMPAGAEKAPMPQLLPPMLATLVDEPFDDPGWIYEIKWDGYRALAYLNNGQVDIRSRNNKSFNEKFYPVYNALKKWPMNMVLDGEIIVVNDNGISSFSALQTWRSEADGQLLFYIFDMLWYNGYSLYKVPLTERRALLRNVLPADDKTILLSENFDTTGTEFFKAAGKMELEGIIAKKADSLYTPGLRSKEWVKIKTEKRQEAIICGYTRNETTSRLFSALLMGVYDKGELQFIGPVGTGFSDQFQEQLLQKLRPLITRKCPFKEVPEYNKPSRFRPNPPKATVTWVKPKLVAEISYRAINPDGAMRQPSFKGLREDKEAQQVVREKAVPVREVVSNEHEWVSKKLSKQGNKKERKTLLNPTDETQVRSIGGHDIKFTNLSKIYWPKEKVTKRDMLNYYYQVAPYMLPYMKDRPQTLNRFPNGINQESFYQKDITGKVPDWIVPFPYYSEADQREKNFLVCTNEASLLYIASLGCIEINPWNSRMQQPDHPDWCIIDLDPDKKNTFEQVIEAAQVTKQVLDTFHIPAYCKTSGSTGLHIYIPLAAKYTYEQSKEFARLIVKLVHAELPGYTSIERYTEKRKGKLYLDFLQNRPQATVAGPYSLRPKPGAPVSAPLHWEEVKPGLQILDFTIFNMMDRIKQEGDLFKPVLGKGIDLVKAMKQMQQVLEQ
jgi:bifunctional non-homologous end joining protein LigD